MADLNWSDAQWQKVNDCVTEAFGKASVASAFLPLYRPLSGSAETVRNERLIVGLPGAPTTVSLDADHDDANLRFVNLTVNVDLSSEQVAEDSLSNAMLAFRRAANILAQEEDRVVFEGYNRGTVASLSPFVRPNTPAQRGLADLRARARFDDLNVYRTQIAAQGLLGVAGAAGLAGAIGAAASIGPAVVSAVVAAISQLERDSNPSPFFCVLGTDLFDRAHDPTPSLVLPADRILPLLKGGSLLRSGMMDANTGIVVSLSAGAVDLIVGTPPTVQFLQRTAGGRFLFRVYERFALRIRDEVTQPFAGFVLDAATAAAQYRQIVRNRLTIEMRARRARLVNL